MVNKVGQHLFGWHRYRDALSAKAGIQASDVTTAIVTPFCTEKIEESISHEERIRIEASKIQTEIRRSTGAAYFQRELNR
jgi:hypothetical protein